MYKDIFGKTRVKLGLHIHTTISDGLKTPDNVVRIYKEHGYDAIAITDHWNYGVGGTINGFPVLPGCEYNIGGRDSRDGVYHILSLCAKREPRVYENDPPQIIIDEIHKAGGIAVLAHPAWSLNTPEMILNLRDIDATEIYNTVSDLKNSRRPDSSLIIDMIASRGCILPLTAADDSHYYGDCGINDFCVSYIMAECESTSPQDVADAIQNKRFYATQGPEIHLSKTDSGFRVDCSPVCEIVFLSNLVWSRRATEGVNLTSADYTPHPDECFIRAVVKDADGKKAWSNIIEL